jgi:hypothetical protein
MSSIGSRRSFLRTLAAAPVFLAGSAPRGAAAHAPAACSPGTPRPGPRVEADLLFRALREVPLARDVAPAFSPRLPRGGRRR